MKAKLLKSQINATHKNLIQIILGIILISLTLSSCSHKVISENETVSKKEFDELQKKYNELLAEKNSTSTPQIDVDLKGQEQSEDSDKNSLELAQDNVEKEDFEAAISSLKKLENSEYKQIKVRAKFLQGEIFFKQKEYDQAMQKYDEIITGYGFSSVVISAIGRKEACMKNLNLPIKQEPYSSIFSDLTKS